LRGREQGRFMYRGASLRNKTPPPRPYGGPRGWGGGVLDQFKQSEVFYKVEFAGSVGSKFGALRDHICTTQGLQVDCVKQVHFD